MLRAFSIISANTGIGILVQAAREAEALALNPVGHGSLGTITTIWV
jgi:hypothetical protein